jgi:CBS domain-containing protein
MIPTAGDLMERHVISVGADTPLLDVHRLFVEEEIHGAPVVDDEGGLVGVISVSDLLRAVEEEEETLRPEPNNFEEMASASGGDYFSAPGDLQEDVRDRLTELRAGDVMTRDVLTVSTRALVPEVARVLRENGVHRVFVVDEGVLLGVLSAFDLIRVLEDWKEASS